MNWKDFATTVAAILMTLSILLGPVACTMRRHQLIADAIKNGADPMEAKCAIEQDTGSDPACIVAAMRQK